MDPITLTALGSFLGAAFYKVGEKIIEKVVEVGIEPAATIARDKMLRRYNQSKAENEIREKAMTALDRMRSEIQNPFERLKITNWVTGQSADTYQLLAATAVEMVELKPEKIPVSLLQALQLDESHRTLLARFLIYFRRSLAESESFSRLIAYANELDRRGSLVGLIQNVEMMAQDTRRMRGLIEQLVSQQGLTDDDQRALENYLELCRERWGHLMLPLVRENVGVLSPGIKRIFIPLLVRDEEAELKARKAVERQAIQVLGRVTEQATEPIDFYSAFSKHRKFILVGIPGVGKTTLLRRTALAFAEGRAEEDVGWKGAPKLPIFIRLRNFGIYLSENRKEFSEPGAGALIAYLEQNLRNDEGIEIPHDFFKRRLEEGGCVVLLDGLDEVLENRVEVAQFVNAFIKKYGKAGNRIGLSSRPKGYEGDVRLQLDEAKLSLLEVRPLLPTGIKALIERLLPLLEDNSQQREQDYLRLTDRILSNQNLTEIASVPLFCSALVQVYKYHGVDLPQRRVDVLAEIANLLLGFWYAQQTDLRRGEELARSDGTETFYPDTIESVEQKSNRLAHLAYFMQSEIKRAEINAEEAQKRLSAYLREHEGASEREARRWAKNFLRSAHEQSGLFVESDPGVFTFLHKHFMEYFAATSLILDQEDPLGEMLKYVDDEWWEQVLLLAAAHPKANNPFRQKLIPALVESANSCEKGSKAWARRLYLAGRMAGDMTTRLPASPRKQIESILFAAATDPEVHPPIRAHLADTLDQFWQPEDLHAFIKIGEGSEAFYIGKYPVTNIQYERFLRLENFMNPDLWCGFPRFSNPDKYGNVWQLEPYDDEGWRWLQASVEHEGSGEENRLIFPRYWRDPRFGINRPSAPVVGVSWWEANAYCKWLALYWDELEEGKQGLPKPGLLRLPTEAEWERAAGGTKPRDRYGWEDSRLAERLDLADITGRANISESNIGRTTPVWIYPLGASPAGVMDMSGNVWEWQANYYVQDRDWFSLRGGSWSRIHEYARVADRYDYRPNDGDVKLGFRVVSLPK